MSVRVDVLLGDVRVPVELDDAAIAAIASAIGHEDPAPAWLTIYAASDYLGLSQHAVRKLVDRRRIPKHQHVRGGRILLRRDDLDRYLQEGSRQ